MPFSTGPSRAAAAVLWRAAGDSVQVALTAGADGASDLPSATLRVGETELEAVVRAAAPHALAATPGRFLGVTRSRTAGERLRLSSHWAMEALELGDGPTRWVSPAEADAELERVGERQALCRFLDGPPRVGRAILLRHCEAEQWREGDDLLRPLTSVGAARAARLIGVLAALRPDVLLSSPALRCRDTLAPAAAALGVEVTEDPAAGERQPERDRLATALEARARGGGTVLLCTHAPVVGALLERFAAARPQLLPRPARLDAGGAWSVEFDAAGAIGMHYLPAPAPVEAP